MTLSETTKRWLTMLMMVLVFLQLPFAQVDAASEYSSNGFTYEIHNGCAVITGYSGGADELVVPGVLNGYTVWGIGASAFYQKSFSTVILPEGITSIEDCAFAYCRQLKNVSLPNSLTNIGENPFIGSPASIKLSPDQPRFATIDGVLFDKKEKRLITYPYSSKASEYNVLQGIYTIGAYAFNDCDHLITVSLPDGLKRIDHAAFRDCSNLASINIPNTVNTIGDNPFQGTPVSIIVAPEQPRFAIINNVLLDKIDKRLITYPRMNDSSTYSVPPGIQGIGAYAFLSSTNLTTVTLPDGITSIGNSAFFGCVNLTTITIPEGLTNVGSYAFCNCSSLAAITLPEGMTSISDDLFCNCSSLAAVTLPESISSIGDAAFADCPATLTVVRGSYAAGWAKEKGITYAYTDALDWLTEESTTN